MLLGALHTFGKLALIAIVTLPIAGVLPAIIFLLDKRKYDRAQRAHQLRVVSS